jgi:hypothetical protein
MERNGASHRITRKRPAQTDLSAGGMRPMNPWFPSGDEGDSYTHDRALSLSVSRHPSGGYNAEVSNHSWDPEDPDRFKAGPFRTPLRAQVAAEALGERTTNSEKPSPEGHRRSRYS